MDMMRWLRIPKPQPNLLQPLLPLKSVLFPGGVLAMKLFEQRYLDMAASSMKAEATFGVVLLTHGDEVAGPGKAPAEFADIGTLAKINTWDMPQLGILHLGIEGTQRFQILQHRTKLDGLVLAEMRLLAPEPTAPLTPEQEPLARLLELMMERIGPERFGPERHFDDASWVSYRLAEILPLKLSIKQNMLEVNDAQVRLQVLGDYLRREGLLN